MEATKQKVKFYLENFENTRNEDVELLVKYIEETTTGRQQKIVLHYIKNHYHFLRDFVRERAYWQNTKGMFPPTKGKKLARRKKQAEVVQVIRREKQSFAQNVYSYARRLFDKN